jgi:hypothetical protein
LDQTTALCWRYVVVKPNLVIQIIIKLGVLATTSEACPAQVVNCSGTFHLLCVVAHTAAFGISEFICENPRKSIRQLMTSHCQICKFEKQIANQSKTVLWFANAFGRFGTARLVFEDAAVPADLAKMPFKAAAASPMKSMRRDCRNTSFSTTQPSTGESMR